MARGSVRRLPTAWCAPVRVYTKKEREEERGRGVWHCRLVADGADRCLSRHTVRPGSKQCLRVGIDNCHGASTVICVGAMSRSVNNVTLAVEI